MSSVAPLWFVDFRNTFFLYLALFSNFGFSVFGCGTALRLKQVNLKVEIIILEIGPKNNQRRQIKDLILCAELSVLWKWWNFFQKISSPCLI